MFSLSVKKQQELKKIQRKKVAIKLIYKMNLDVICTKKSKGSLGRVHQDNEISVVADL